MGEGVSHVSRSRRKTRIVLTMPRFCAALGRGSIGWVWLLAMLGACGDSEHVADAGSPVSYEAIAVLPDTQFYACAYGEIFERQVRWIIEQRARRGVGLVLHTGDIVDSDIDSEWQIAAQSMHQLDGVVPYLITSGNHDLSAGRDSLLPSYFDARALEGFDLEAGTYERERLDNSFAIVQLAGREWLVLGLEFGPRDAIVAWADSILERYAALPTILFTHAYLYGDAERYDRAISPHQRYHPDDYALTPEQGIHDGEDLWAELIERHENVKLVLSGHVIPDGVARSSPRRSTGSVVHEVLANYQLCDRCPCAEVEGGGGYLRLLTFSEQSIEVSTYSPHHDRWLDDEDNAFVLPLDP